MDQTLLDYIRSLSSRDAKTLTQRALKLAEETGELAKVALPFENAPSTLHRIATKHKVAEEAVDNILVALSILHKLDYDDEDIASLMRDKSAKWDNLMTREGLLQDPNKIPHELHITVSCEVERIERFQDVCKGIGVKPIVLDLPTKDGGSMQDVMTSSHFFGTTTDAIEKAKQIDHVLQDRGFTVLRQKVETVPWHPHAPQTKSDKIHEGCYFECHVGVIMNSINLCKTPERLKTISGNCGAKMSRNVFKTYDDGQYIQMVTMRTYGVRTEFEIALEFLLNSLESNGFEYEKVIREYSIYDTNVHHDHAWIGK